jgi:FkbM family methyltransferase
MYSQHSEDDLIVTLVPAVGRFLDIGAYRPKDLSNTRLLYERGWSGVCIEPSPENMNYLIDAYGFDERITLVQAIIGASDGLALMDVTDGPVSTTDANVRRIWAKDGHYRGRVWIPQRTIDQINSQFGPFDFVNIDAEGTSGMLLERLLASDMQPSAICVEHDGRESSIQRAALRRGYDIALTNETNMVLARAAS